VPYARRRPRARKRVDLTRVTRVGEGESRTLGIHPPNSDGLINGLANIAVEECATPGTTR
jgi:hypothetical protein